MGCTLPSWCSWGTGARLLPDTAWAGVPVVTLAGRGGCRDREGCWTGLGCECALCGWILALLQRSSGPIVQNGKSTGRQASDL